MGAPFKMKGSPMQRNFGIGSPLSKVGSDSKSTGKPDFIGPQAPIKDVTEEKHPHTDKEQKVHPQKQDAEGGENPNDSAEGEGGFWNDLWDNSVLGQVVDAGKKGEIGDNLKEAYLGDNSIIGGTVKGIKQFRTNKKNEKIVDEKIKQEDLKKKVAVSKVSKKNLLATNKGTAKAESKESISAKKALSEKRRQQESQSTIKPTVKTV